MKEVIQFISASYMLGRKERREDKCFSKDIYFSIVGMVLFFLVPPALSTEAS